MYAKASAFVKKVEKRGRRHEKKKDDGIVACPSVLRRGALAAGARLRQRRRLRESSRQQTSTQTAGTETPAPDNLVRGGVGDGQYKESPLVHEQVEKGELPPIEERLPEEPAVVEVDEIGAYGGTYVGAGIRPQLPDRLIQRACASSHF